MANLDPQVQIRLIELAEKVAGGKARDDKEYWDTFLKHFDEAYKALAKTLKETGQS
jgi:phage-related tail protein